MRGGKKVERCTGMLNASFGDWSSKGTQGGEKSDEKLKLHDEKVLNMECKLVLE